MRWAALARLLDLCQKSRTFRAMWEFSGARSLAIVAANLFANGESPFTWDVAAVFAGVVLYGLLIARLQFRLFGVSLLVKRTVSKKKGLHIVR